MKWMKQALIISLSALTLSACIKVDINDRSGTGTGNGDSEDPNVSKVLTGTIDKSTTLLKGAYTLRGYVYVNNGATLTIEAGSIIKSDVTEKGALIIERGSKLIADGKADQPII